MTNEMLNKIINDLEELANDKRNEREYLFSMAYHVCINIIKQHINQYQNQSLKEAGYS